MVWQHGIKHHRYAVLVLNVCILSTILLSQTWAAPVRHDFPKVGKYEVLSGDFHMHTVNSDGTLTTRQRAEEAHQYGYDVITVTDHGNSRGYRVAQQTGAPLGMVVLCGFETGLNGKEHMNVIGAPADMKPRSPHVLAEKSGEKEGFYQDELKRLNSAGAIVIYNHPHVGYREPVLWGVKEGMIRGIEVKNGVVDKGWNTVFSHGSWCYPDAFSFALNNNLAIFANSDQHGPRNPKISQWTTLVLAQDRTPAAVMDAIRDRRTIAWFDGMLWGREDLLRSVIKTAVTVDQAGDQITLTNNSPVAFKVKIGDGDVEIPVPAYGEGMWMAKGGLAGATLTWTNVWTSLTTNLVTKVDP